MSSNKKSVKIQTVGRKKTLKKIEPHFGSRKLVSLTVFMKV